MSTTDTTIARCTVITDGGAARYRDYKFPRLVARRDRNGVLSGIEVVVSWAGHEARATIDGEYTIAALTETADGRDDLLWAIKDADCHALVAIIREATDARPDALDLYSGSGDYTAVRTTVAAAIREELDMAPATPREAIEWRWNFGHEKLVEIVGA